MKNELDERVEKLAIEAIRLYQHVQITPSNDQIFTKFLELSMDLILAQKESEIVAIVVGLRKIAALLVRTNYFEAKLQSDFDLLCTSLEKKMDQS
ncbi:MAG: hypothetical protein GQ574_28320 [Crocinitomix sp.]|nr:hypothetical protein [Crocinitomix sp.]